ncbi:MAG: ACP S-malonyltransferase [Candidatus Omnitrophota bacterium]
MAIRERIAYIFPGQGAQYVGMGRDLYDNFPKAREVFEEANEVAGFDIKRLCFEGPIDKLSTTAHSQPAILVTSIAALRSLESAVSDINNEAVLGLSLGEYTALVAAGSIAFKDAVTLVKLRGRYMEEASRENPGKMASVLGLDRDVAEEICRDAGCEIANLNCPGQIVISGTVDSINKATTVAKEKGAKRSIVLEVSGPFHSSLMNGAKDRLKAALDGVDIRPPRVSFIGNVNASYEKAAAKIKENLLTQLTSRTNWEDSIKLIAAGGIKRCLEIGPGKVLKGLIKRIDAGITVHGICTVEDIDNFVKNCGSEAGG